MYLLRVGGLRGGGLRRNLGVLRGRTQVICLGRTLFLGLPFGFNLGVSFPLPTWPGIFPLMGVVVLGPAPSNFAL